MMTMTMTTCLWRVEFLYKGSSCMVVASVGRSVRVPFCSVLFGDELR